MVLYNVDHILIDPSLLIGECLNWVSWLEPSLERPPMMKRGQDCNGSRGPGLPALRFELG